MTNSVKEMNNIPDYEVQGIDISPKRVVPRIRNEMQRRLKALLVIILLHIPQLVHSTPPVQERLSESDRSIHLHQTSQKPHTNSNKEKQGQKALPTRHDCHLQSTNKKETNSTKPTPKRKVTTYIAATTPSTHKQPPDQKATTSNTKSSQQSTLPIPPTEISFTQHKPKQKITEARPPPAAARINKAQHRAAHSISHTQPTTPLRT
jgi:hypothetical protein